MAIQIGGRPDHGFHEPLGLLSDCHRRIERFLHVLVAVERQASGGPLGPGDRRALDRHGLPAGTRADVTVNKLIIQKNVDDHIRPMAEDVNGIPDARAFVRLPTEVEW